MSGEMYSQRWSEPGPIEYAILYDSGWKERTTGKLSETIDLTKNILKSFSIETLSELRTLMQAIILLLLMANKNT